MTLNVLQEKQQITNARAELQRRGLSALDSPAGQFFRRLRLNRSINIGDELKSWDVLRTVEYLEKHLTKEAAILDIGAFASEVLSVLHRIGFNNLTGVDLNPKLRRSPYAEAIHYEIADFMSTPFPDSTFDAITAISVIEHGYSGDRLLRETARLLRPGGLFIASFDYWPEKIDTREQKFFDMDWLIFSKADVRELVDVAATHGMVPTGALSFDAANKPIECAGKQYTFGWLVLAKTGP